MEIQLTPEREAQLAELARQQGREPAELADEALAAWLDYQAWAAETRQKIEEGWQQAEDGTVRRLSPEESRADLARRKTAYLRDAAR